MKILTILIFIFNSLFLSAQTIKFNIQGTVENTEHAKFAYLSTFYQQVTVSSPKIFTVVPIINGKFEFSDTFDLEGKDYQHACMFVDERGNISKEELASKFKRLVWIAGADKNLRVIILENMKLSIEGRDQMKDSKIVEGGMLTKQLDEKVIAVKMGNRKLVEFIKKYPDSPVSFDQVQTVTNMINLSDKDRLENAWGSPSELYEALSERLRNSKKGLALKKVIDEKFKP